MNGHFLSLRFRHIHCIDDACRRIEIKAEILERRPVCRTFARLAAEQQDVVVGRSHTVGPQGIGHFQNIVYFLARKAHGVEHILVLIQVEHVVHIDIPFLNPGVVGQRSRQRNIRTADVKL